MAIAAARIEIARDALDQRREPPVYRPFAIAALAATLVGGIPLGAWMLWWLYGGGAAVPAEWRFLHAHLQLFGFFAMLIPGVAQHLLARFAGRPVAPDPVMRGVFAALAAALALRVAATWLGAPAGVAAACVIQAAAFVAFAAWVWRALAPPGLGPVRHLLAASSGWFAAACLLELTLRWRARRAGVDVPDRAAMNAVYAMGLYGGVLGWVLGVLLRAGPMFVPGWRAPRRAADVLPAALAGSVALAAAGTLADWRGTAGIALERSAQLVALGTLLGVLLRAGALRIARRTLPLLSRSLEEARIFRLAVLSAVAAVIGSAVAAAAAWGGAETHLLGDAVRHLLTVGFLTSMVVAMSFRLIPVLEGTALRWPRLRSAAFWALLLAVVLRSAEVLIGLGWAWVVPAVPLSGVLVWVALASVAANLISAMRRRAPHGQSASSASASSSVATGQTSMPSAVVRRRSPR